METNKGPMPVDVIVEGKFDVVIINALLKRAFPNAIFSISCASKSLLPTNLEISDVGQLRNSGRTAIIVYDQDFGLVSDRVHSTIPEQNLFWCPAIPTVEAWLFADEITLSKFLPEHMKSTARHLPSPENIPYPKMIRHYLLRDQNKAIELLSSIDLVRATARSQSLAFFLNTASSALGQKRNLFGSVENYGSLFDREIISSLVGEVVSSSEVIFRSSDGNIVTAGRMIQELNSGTTLGREYATAMLRIVRDILMRQAKKPTCDKIE